MSQQPSQPQPSQQQPSQPQPSQPQQQPSLPLPLNSYHRASHIGSGTYGTVVEVYNDDGEKYALKVFESSTNASNAVMDLGAMREISILRMLRRGKDESSIRHANIINLEDVQTDWTNDDNDDDDDDDSDEKCTKFLLSIALPFYNFSLATAIEQQKYVSKRTKVVIAHGIVSAVHFLHCHGILHRDIKSDNILLQQEHDCWKPILIDFSLAKPITETLWGIRTTATTSGKHSCCRIVDQQHTGEVGSVVYTAPEISFPHEYSDDTYGFPSDMYSVGVVVLELLTGRGMTAVKATTARTQVRNVVATLKNQPFPQFVQALLHSNPTQRPTASQALVAPIFQKFGLCDDDDEPTLLRIDQLLPYDDDDENEENKIPDTNGTADDIDVGKNGRSAAPAILDMTAIRDKRQKKALLTRIDTLERILRRMTPLLLNTATDDNYQYHPWTLSAAYEYSVRMEKEIMDDSSRLWLIDCCIVAIRFFELTVLDLQDVPDIFPDWDISVYADTETTIFMLLDYCLYPRQLVLRK